MRSLRRGEIGKTEAQREREMIIIIIYIYIQSMSHFPKRGTPPETLDFSVHAGPAKPAVVLRSPSLSSQKWDTD
jgi:hypothetical protein